MVHFLAGTVDSHSIPQPRSNLTIRRLSVQSKETISCDIDILLPKWSLHIDSDRRSLVPANKGSGHCDLSGQMITTISDQGRKERYCLKIPNLSFGPRAIRHGRFSNKVRINLGNHHTRVRETDVWPRQWSSREYVCEEEVLWTTWMGGSWFCDVNHFIEGNHRVQLVANVRNNMKEKQEKREEEHEHEMRRRGEWKGRLAVYSRSRVSILVSWGDIIDWRCSREGILEGIDSIRLIISALIIISKSLFRPKQELPRMASVRENGIQWSVRHILLNNGEIVLPHTSSSLISHHETTRRTLNALFLDAKGQYTGTAHHVISGLQMMICWRDFSVARTAAGVLKTDTSEASLESDHSVTLNSKFHLKVKQRHHLKVKQTQQIKELKKSKTIRKLHISKITSDLLSFEKFSTPWQHGFYCRLGARCCSATDQPLLPLSYHGK